MRGRDARMRLGSQREHRNETLVTYLSNMPSVAPTLRMLVAWYWAKQRDPLSHGIRSDRSRRWPMREKILYERIGRLAVFWMAERPWMTSGSVVPDTVGERGGREDAVARPRMMKRTVINAKYPYWSKRQNTSDTTDDLLWCAFNFDSSFVSVSSPNFSNRLLVSTSISSPVALAPTRALTLSTILVMPSQINQPSQALPPTPLPNIISPMMSATRVRRQAFPRSSVGSSTARTPCTSSCL